MMPSAPLHPCAQPGCPALVARAERWCEPHAKERARAYNEARPASDDFYDSARWRAFRRMFLAEHPLCVDCAAQGRVTPANEVDHIVPRSAGGADLDPANCRGLCKPCHSRRTAQSGNRWQGG